MSTPRNARALGVRRNQRLVWMLLATLLAGCNSAPGLSHLTAVSATGPTGALMVSGECDAPAGTMLLVRAQGAPAFGAQVDSAALSTIRQGRYVVDLALHETLSYRVTVILSPAWNTAGQLPTSPPRPRDPALVVRQTPSGWQLRRQFETRLGTLAQEQDLLREHLRLARDALQALERSATTLREIESRHDRPELARWLRLHLERPRGSMLSDEGLDPIFPSVHSDLRDYDDALLKRYHAVLAQLTGAPEDEAIRLAKSWQVVDRAGEKARLSIHEIANKLTKASPPERAGN